MRVLFLNPGAEPTGTPHYGLAILGTLLKMRGHQVRVADYQCSQSIPPLKGILLTFRPNVVGISTFSALQSLADDAIQTIRAWDADVPIICGGPHATCYTDVLAEDRRIDYVVVGEAETAIAHLVEEASRQERAQIIRSELPDVNELPIPDYSIFYDFANIRFFPLVSSRGCPYNCSFCAAHLCNSKKWRAREVAACIEELSTMSHKLPNVQEVIIWDDNFSLDLKRGKQLLEAYLESGLAYPPRAANIRADRVDEELVQLFKAAGCREIQFGVEHGDPTVFSAIDKGETLNDIRQAARIVKKHGLKLTVSFIIGLPGDSVKKTLASARLARELQVDQCYWNILVAYQGTRVYEYFKAKGRLSELRVPKTWSPTGREEWPNVDTPDFTASERVEAKRIAEIFSEQVPLRGRLRFVCASAWRYGFVKELLLLLITKLARKVKLHKRRSPGAITSEASQHVSDNRRLCVQ